MIEDEKIVRNLEKLDDTISQINKSLRQLKSKMEDLDSLNTDIRNNNLKWLNFFDIKKNLQPVLPAEDSLVFSEPEDPFKTVNDDGDRSELVDFSLELLPEKFRNIKEIECIYEFIRNRRGTSIFEIYEEFGEVTKDLVDIYMQVLSRRNFVRCEQNIFTVL